MRNSPLLSRSGLNSQSHREVSEQQIRGGNGAFSADRSCRDRRRGYAGRQTGVGHDQRRVGQQRLAAGQLGQPGQQERRDGLAPHAGGDGGLLRPVKGGLELGGGQGDVGGDGLGEHDPAAPAQQAMGGE